jgi:glycosyltransferase involved in cell wall biosynthesis
MRILLNALVVNRGGHKTYFNNFIPYFGQLGVGHDFLLLYSPWQEEIFDFDLPNNFSRLVYGPQSRSVLRKVTWEQVKLPSILKHEKIDLMFSPTPVTTLYSPCPIVIAIRNPNLFMSLKLKDIRYLGRNWLLMLLTKISAKKAAGIIVVSRYSRDEAARILGIDQDKTEVIYHGIGQQFLEGSHRSITHYFEASCPYILTVSTIQKHKNQLRLIDAFARLCTGDDLGYDLVIAGGIESGDDYKRLLLKINQHELEKRVHYLGEIPYNDLPALYHGATIFVMPSLLESFGHPLVEAMASGVPIVASNTTAIPEICGDAAVYFDPLRVDEMSSSMRSVLLDENLRKQLIVAGFDRVNTFSWADSAQRMLNLFEEAVSG